jgi:hypothetical protein
MTELKINPKEIESSEYILIQIPWWNSGTGSARRIMSAGKVLLNGEKIKPKQKIDFKNGDILKVFKREYKLVTE